MGIVIERICRNYKYHNIPQLTDVRFMEIHGETLDVAEAKSIYIVDIS